VLKAGFDDLARQPLRDLDRFGDAPAFGTKPGTSWLVAT